jgi:hypothetical protein
MSAKKKNNQSEGETAVEDRKPFGVWRLAFGDHGVSSVSRFPGFPTLPRGRQLVASDQG